MIIKKQGAKPLVKMRNHNYYLKWKEALKSYYSNGQTFSEGESVILFLDEKVLKEVFLYSYSEKDLPENLNIQFVRAWLQSIYINKDKLSLQLGEALMVFSGFVFADDLEDDNYWGGSLIALVSQGINYFQGDQKDELELFFNRRQDLTALLESVNEVLGREFKSLGLDFFRPEGGIIYNRGRANDYKGIVRAHRLLSSPDEAIIKAIVDLGLQNSAPDFTMAEVREILEKARIYSSSKAALKKMLQTQPRNVVYFLRKAIQGASYVDFEINRRGSNSSSSLSLKIVPGFVYERTTDHKLGYFLQTNSNPGIWDSDFDELFLTSTNGATHIYQVRRHHYYEYAEYGEGYRLYPLAAANCLPDDAVSYKVTEPGYGDEDELFFTRLKTQGDSVIFILKHENHIHTNLPLVVLATQASEYFQKFLDTLELKRALSATIKLNGRDYNVFGPQEDNSHFSLAGRIIDLAPYKFVNPISGLRPPAVQNEFDVGVPLEIDLQQVVDKLEILSEESQQVVVTYVQEVALDFSSKYLESLPEGQYSWKAYIQDDLYQSGNFEISRRILSQRSSWYENYLIDAQEDYRNKSLSPGYLQLENESPVLVKEEEVNHLIDILVRYCLPQYIYNSKYDLVFERLWKRAEKRLDSELNPADRSMLKRTLLTQLSKMCIVDYDALNYKVGGNNTPVWLGTNQREYMLVGALRADERSSLFQGSKTTISNSFKIKLSNQKEYVLELPSTLIRNGEFRSLPKLEGEIGNDSKLTVQKIEKFLEGLEINGHNLGTKDFIWNDENGGYFDVRFDYKDEKGKTQSLNLFTSTSQQVKLFNVWNLSMVKLNEAMLQSLIRNSERALFKLESKPDQRGVRVNFSQSVYLLCDFEMFGEGRRLRVKAWVYRGVNAPLGKWKYLSSVRNIDLNVFKTNQEAVERSETFINENFNLPINAQMMTGAYVKSICYYDEPGNRLYVTKYIQLPHDLERYLFLLSGRLAEECWIEGDGVRTINREMEIEVLQRRPYYVYEHVPANVGEQVVNFLLGIRIINL